MKSTIFIVLLLIGTIVVSVMNYDDQTEAERTTCLASMAGLELIGTYGGNTLDGYKSTFNVCTLYQWSGAAYKLEN